MFASLVVYFFARLCLGPLTCLRGRLCTTTPEKTSVNVSAFEGEEGVFKVRSRCLKNTVKLLSYSKQHASWGYLFEELTRHYLFFMWELTDSQRHV